MMDTQKVKKYVPELAGLLLGALGGFLYWKFVGCTSGTCAIKSNWYLMIPWGMLVGYLAGSLAGDLFRRKQAGNKSDNSVTEE